MSGVPSAGPNMLQGSNAMAEEAGQRRERCHMLTGACSAGAHLYCREVDCNAEV